MLEGTNNSELADESAKGDDDSLSNNGSTRTYWYSVTDGHYLCQKIRADLATRLNSQDFHFYNKAEVEGHAHSALRSNRLGVFIADPYYCGAKSVEYFENYLTSDIDRITGHVGTSKWIDMPTTLILPVLFVKHWRCIVVDIDYGDPHAHQRPNVAITINDPYGDDYITRREELHDVILAAVERLYKEKYPQLNETDSESRSGDEFDNEMQDINSDSKNKTFSFKFKITEVKKLIDQQGKGHNSWDCGAITYANIQDYVDFVSQQKKATEIPQFTIHSNPQSKEHNILIKFLRESHSKIVSQALVSAVTYNAKQEAVDHHIREENAQNIKELKKQQYDDSQLALENEIASLPPELISYFFFLLDMQSTGKEDNTETSLQLKKKILCQIQRLQIEEEKVNNQENTKSATSLIDKFQERETQLQVDIMLQTFAELTKQELLQEFNQHLEENFSDPQVKSILQKKIIHIYEDGIWTHEEIVDFLNISKEKNCLADALTEILTLVINFRLPASKMQEIVTNVPENSLPASEIRKFAFNSHFRIDYPNKDDKALILELEKYNVSNFAAKFDYIHSQYLQVLIAYDNPPFFNTQSPNTIKTWNSDLVKSGAKCLKDLHASGAKLYNKNYDWKSDLEYDLKKLPGIVAIVGKAIKLISGYDPRIIQNLSVLLLLDTKHGTDESNNLKGNLAQIYSGEGKSTIISMFSAIKALQGHSVDIITTSGTLAIRDTIKYSKFYEMLSLSAGHNTGNILHVNEPRQCYIDNIAYGTVSSFAGDVLRQEYHGYNIRGNRKFDTIIIDEADSMLIDSRGHITYLSSPVPNIWKITYILKILWGKLQVVSNNKDKLTDEELNKYLTENLEETLKKTSISPYLKNYIKESFPTWIESAKRAQKLIKGREYTVKDDKIVIIDLNTGVLQYNTFWRDGLHQFIEMKHNLLVTELSLVTNYQSNVGLFKRYQSKEGKTNVFGVTGTLGVDVTKDLLSNTYNLNNFLVPSYKQKKLLEWPPIAIKLEEDWLNEITMSAIREAKNERVVLIICNTIAEAEKLYLKIEPLLHPLVPYLYTENDSSNTTHEIECKALDSGNIIIATNLAGRGTDIKITDKVETHGGLHVCLTFLPDNVRVELQAFGRTGREGKPGTAQMIYRTPFQTDTQSIRELRDQQEQATLKFAEKEFKQLANKEKLFVDFCEFRDVQLKEIKKGVFAVALTTIRTAKKSIAQKFKTLSQKKEAEQLLDTLEAITAAHLALGDTGKKKFKELFQNVLPEVYKAYNDALNMELNNPYDQITKDSISERWGFLLEQTQNLKFKEQRSEFQKFKKQITEDYQAGKIIQNPAFYNKRISKAIKDDEYKLVRFYSKKSKELDKGSFIPHLYQAYGIYNNKNLSYQDRVDKACEAMQQAYKNLFADILLFVSTKTLPGKHNEAKEELYRKIFLIIDSNKAHLTNAKDTSKTDKKPLYIQKVSLHSVIKEKDRNRLSEEINTLYSMGLEYVIVIGHSTPRWKLACLGIFGGLQIIVGGALAVCSLSFGSALSIALISEGISDIYAAVMAQNRPELDFKKYGLMKVLSVFITALTTCMALSNASFASSVAKLGTEQAAYNAMKYGIQKQVIRATNSQVGKFLSHAVSRFASPSLIRIFGLRYLDSESAPSNTTNINEELNNHFDNYFLEQIAANGLSNFLAAQQVAQAGVKKAETMAAQQIKEEINTNPHIINYIKSTANKQSEQKNISEQVEQDLQNATTKASQTVQIEETFAQELITTNYTPPKEDISQEASNKSQDNSSMELDNSSELSANKQSLESEIQINTSPVTELTVKNYFQAVAEAISENIPVQKTSILEQDLQQACVTNILKLNGAPVQDVTNFISHIKKELAQHMPKILGKNIFNEDQKSVNLSKLSATPLEEFIYNATDEQLNNAIHSYKSPNQNFLHNVGSQHLSAYLYEVNRLKASVSTAIIKPFADTVATQAGELVMQNALNTGPEFNPFNGITGYKIDDLALLTTYINHPQINIGIVAGDNLENIDASNMQDMQKPELFLYNKGQQWIVLALIKSIEQDIPKITILCKSSHGSEVIKKEVGNVVTKLGNSFMAANYKLDVVMKYSNDQKTISESGLFAYCNLQEMARQLSNEDSGQFIKKFSEFQFFSRDQVIERSSEIKKLFALAKLKTISQKGFQKQEDLLTALQGALIPQKSHDEEYLVNLVKEHLEIEKEKERKLAEAARHKELVEKMELDKQEVLYQEIQDFFKKGVPPKIIAEVKKISVEKVEQILAMFTSHNNSDPIPIDQDPIIIDHSVTSTLGEHHGSNDNLFS